MNTIYKYKNLEDRTFEFAKNVRTLISVIPKKLINMDDCKQVIRSSGSVGANYREANEALSSKDFYMRIKISRKEAKESVFWLRLLVIENVDLKKQSANLANEAEELSRIFGSIVRDKKQ